MTTDAPQAVLESAADTARDDLKTWRLDCTRLAQLVNTTAGQVAAARREGEHYRAAILQARLGVFIDALLMTSPDAEVRLPEPTQEAFCDGCDELTQVTQVDGKLLCENCR